MHARSQPRPPVDPARLNGRRADTMWTNLGWWPGASSYPEAARALAQRVGEAAQLSSIDSVVDYACGYGDSLRLWVEQFDVRRVIGVEPDPQVCAVIRERVASWGLTERIRVHCARAEDSAPRQLAADVTAVVSVDAAYHFVTRMRWLQTVLADLPSGGRLGLADLSVEPTAMPSRLLGLLGRVMGIPRENWMSAAEILEFVVASGGVETTYLAAGQAVLDGFVRNARDMQAGVALGLTRWALAALRRRRVVDYLILGVSRT